MGFYAATISAIPVATATLSTSDLIEAIGVITSLITALIAIVISIKTLRQNAKMIEESTRPYVAVYREYIQVLSVIHEYLVIKNFGNSGATIDSLSIVPPYEHTDFPANAKVFAHINGTFIAPGQSFSSVLFIDAFKNDRIGITKIEITYHAGKKKYSDTFTLNEDEKADIRFTKPEPSPNRSVQSVVAKVTEEILRRSL